MNFCRSCTLLMPFVFLCFCGKSLLHCSDRHGAYPYGSCFRLFCFLAHRIYLWLLLASDRNRLASVRILSISIFIRTMPSQCV